MPEFIKHSLIKPNVLESRLYQQNLMKSALEKGNTLVVMPTALGKTMVAVLLIAEILKDNPNKKALFLAPTKPLVVQHHQTLQNLLALDKSDFALLTGTVKVKERKELWEKSKIISATPQTIRNDLRKNRISLEDVGVLIIDESHRSVGIYSYVEVVKRYMEEVPKPLVLGLTASPSSEKINEICENLFAKNVEVRTEEDPDVKPYIPEKKIGRVYVNLPPDYLEIRDLLKTCFNEYFQKLRNMGYHVWPRKRDILRVQQDSIRKKKYPVILYSSALLKIYYALELVETQGADQLYNYFEKLKKQKLKTSLFMQKNKSIAKAMKLTTVLHEKGREHPKFEKLLEIVAEEIKKKKMIIFAHYRDTAARIVKEINKIDGVSAVRFVGQATREGDVGLKQAEQKEIISKFRKGDYNAMVCTSVGEEGLDIPSVDLVIFYEPVPSDIRKIQREGRTGRKYKGEVKILITKNTRDESNYWTSISKEKKMHKALDEIKKGVKKKVKQKKLDEFFEG